MITVKKCVDHSNIVDVFYNHVFVARIIDNGAANQLEIWLELVKSDLLRCVDFSAETNSSLQDMCIDIVGSTIRISHPWKDVVILTSLTSRER